MNKERKFRSNLDQKMNDLSLVHHTISKRDLHQFFSLENFQKNKLLMHEIIQSTSFDDDDDNCQCVQDVRYISFVNFSYPHTIINQSIIIWVGFLSSMFVVGCCRLFSLKSKSYYKFEPQLIMERIIIINVFFFASFFPKKNYSS